ncbi:hypothetical protein L3X38_040111 [Prunus dulcis]|uniref:DNA-directed RNA polymerase n=1 Tax=Prunus dulcis TaxID=3755 RepID=A0AAD4V8U0_PRUDU|nr:hypothetical protein L3X38_040111 [Prunus dulcis]
MDWEVKVGALHKVPMWDFVQAVVVATRVLEIRFGIWELRQTPQSPIVHTSAYKKYCIDEYPTDTNAIIAVLSYTGYDMEDAMILNKSSVERGIYQTETVDLSDQKSRSDGSRKYFMESNIERHRSIDSDGLPCVGQKGPEDVIVDYVAIDGKKHLQNHPQKLWPDIDIPFSEVTGVCPDLIINPHAFPLRMAIGMLLESIAAKVHSTGMVDQITSQPIKGRKGGGVKGLPPVRAPKVFSHASDTNKGMETVAIPYVFKYLAAELAAMSIKMTLQLSI